MQVVQLYIEGQRVDLFKDESVSITQTIQNVKDFSKVFTEFSKTFNLPASKTNNKIFEHYYNFAIDDGFDARKKKTARIELNNKPFKKGKLKLEGVTLKNGKAHTYKVTFFGNTVDLKDLLGEDTLSSLDWLNNFDEVYNSANIKTGLISGFDKTVDSVSYTDTLITPLISHTIRPFYNTGFSNVAYPDENSGNLYDGGTGSSDHGIHWTQLKYAMPVHLIVKAIEESYGITFSSDFFDSSNDPFYKLYMWLHRKKGEVFQEGEPTQSLITGFPNVYPNQNSSSMSRIISNPTKFYVFNLTGSQVINYTLTVTTTGAQTYDIILKKDGITQDQTAVTGAGTGQMTGALTNTNSGYQVFISSADAFDITQVSMAVSDTALGESSTFSTSSTISITIDRDFIITEQIPKIKVIDFLTGLFKMFNLTAFYEGDEIIVKTLDDYYSDSSKTWDITKYIDDSTSNVDVALPYKEVQFAYEGLGTKLALQHQQAFNQDWGTIEYKGGDNYDAGGGIYTVLVPFEHLKYERLIDDFTDADTTVQVGWYVDDNNDPYYGKPLLFYPISNTGNNIRFMDDDTTTSTVTTYFIPSNSIDIDPTTNINNINFNAELNEYTRDSLFTGTLFKQFYQTYIEDVYNNKLRLTKTKAFLPISFLLNYTLADKIKIQDKKYKINSIDSNLESGESTLELLNIPKRFIGDIPFISGTINQWFTVQTSGGASVQWRITYETGTQTSKSYVKTSSGGITGTDTLTNACITFLPEKILQSGVNNTTTKAAGTIELRLNNVSVLTNTFEAGEDFDGSRGRFSYAGITAGDTVYIIITEG